MTLDEHILRITERRNPKPSLDTFSLTVCMHHKRVTEGLSGRRSHYQQLPDLFDGFVRFFNDAPEDVNVLEALKLNPVNSELIAKYSWFDFYASLHTYVSLAHESAMWLEDQFVIMDAGPDMPEDGWQGAPVCFAGAINTIVAYAEAKSFYLAKALDEAQAALQTP